MKKLIKTIYIIYLKIKISNKSSVFKYICRKTETSVNNFIKYFGNQIISLRKNFEKIFCTIASAKKKKSIKNVYSKFFKLNLFLCKRKKLTGFLINSYSLKNTKLTIDDFSLFNSNSKYTIWDIIIYFIQISTFL